MLTQMEARVSVIILSFSSKLGLVPLIFQNGILSQSPSKTRYYAVFAANCILFLNAVFFLWKAKNQFSNGQESVGLLSSLMILSSVCAGGVVLNLERNVSEIIALSNLVRKATWKFGSGDESNEERFARNRIREKCTTMLLVFLALGGIFSAPACIVLSWLSFNSIASRLLYSLLTSVSFFLFGNFIVVQASVFLSSTLTVVYWLKKICVDRTTTERVNQGNYTWEEVCAIYRRCLILSELQNMGFGSLFLPSCKLWAVLALYLCVFAVTKVGSSLGPFLLATTIVYLGCVIVLLAPSALALSAIFNVSTNFRRTNFRRFVLSAQGRVERDLRIKSLMSLPVTKSKVGSVYHMESKAKLTLFDNVARGIAFVLMSFK